jgi:hypothetical protein
MKYNKNLAGIQITDELINRSSSSSLRLAHDTILASTVVVCTAPAGGGTLLALTTDYTLGSEDTRLTTEVGATVNTTLAVVNGAYLNTNLYVTYKTVGDYAEAEDVGMEFVNFNIASSDQTYTLPNPRTTGARGIRISWSGGTGTFKLMITGTINGFSSWEGRGTGSLTIYSDGSAWYADSEGVFDRGTLSTGRFIKHINGDLFEDGVYATGVGASSTIQSVSSLVFPHAFIDTAIRMSGSCSINVSWVGFLMYTFTIDSASAYSVICLNTTNAQVVTWSWQASGRWRA